MTLQEAGQYATTKLLEIYGEGEASAISGWLMENIAGVKKIDRVAAQVTMNQSQLSRFNDALDRLQQQEPIQYVLNESWFLGFRFYVDQRVLIPRPETEELVEWIITDCKFPIDELRILDIGSGSGCIPISLKRRLGKAEVSSVDISDDALAVAKKNANDLGVNVEFSSLDFLQEKQRGPLPIFDVIVSNPPYIPFSDQETMHRNVLSFEPALALFVPNENPLVFYEAIAAFGLTHLNATGAIYVEMHEDHAQQTQKLFETLGYQTEIKIDMQGKQRMLRARRNVVV